MDTLAQIHCDSGPDLVLLFTLSFIVNGFSQFVMINLVQSTIKRLGRITILQAIHLQIEIWAF